jgi:hypothetical protein
MTSRGIHTNSAGHGPLALARRAQTLTMLPDGQMLRWMMAGTGGVG